MTTKNKQSISRYDYLATFNGSRWKSGQEKVQSLFQIVEVVTSFDKDGKANPFVKYLEADDKKMRRNFENHFLGVRWARGKVKALTEAKEEMEAQQALQAIAEDAADSI